MDAVQAHAIAAKLIAAFAWRIDREGAKGIGDLFAPDAQFTVPSGDPDWAHADTLRGRDVIAARWLNRPTRRVTRHVHLNLEIMAFDDDRIVCRSVGIGYRHDGAGWGEPTPMIVADYDDECIRGADDAWRFARRRISAVFVSHRL